VVVMNRDAVKAIYNFNKPLLNIVKI